MILFTIRFREGWSRMRDIAPCSKINFDKETSMALIIMPFLVTAAAVSMFVLATNPADSEQDSQARGCSDLGTSG
ncbi:hypothetical protein CIW50_13360 [Tardiphaga sp. P9-11]|jgi:hypothetical protein|nr:hypothetical protein CIW50_13360 [Tardiphaga sp. P9-11]